MAKPGTEQNHRPYPGKLPEPMIQHHGKTLFGPMSEWQKLHRVPPVLLLTGQPGIGKRAMAYFLAQWLLCENHSNSLTPCNTCLSCQTLLSGNAVQITEISSGDEDEESSTSLKIDQFRDLKSSMGYGIDEGQYKFILIPRAERMTPQAANSVLKLLEETPKGWIFFLTTHDSSLLLPTLVSRCQILRLKPLPASEVQKLLIDQGVEKVRSQVCAEISQGSWKRALSFAQDEAWEERKIIFQFIKEPHRSIHALMDWATQKPSSFEVLVDFLEQLTAELLTWSTTQPLEDPEKYPWKNSDAQNELSAHARQTVKHLGNLESARSFWLDRSQRLAQARQESLTPVNRKILVQDILFPWCQL